MDINRNKTFGYVFVFFSIIVLFTAIASYFYFKSDNAVGPNLITAFVGVVMSALVTLVLLNGQTKDEEGKERNLKLYNAKLKTYSNFVSFWYKALSDNQITPDELRELRTILFGKVFFYVGNKDVFEVIEKELSSMIKKKIDIDSNDPKITDLFTKIVSILQNDLNGQSIKPKESFGQRVIMKIKTIFLNLLSSKQKNEKDDCQRKIWLYLDRIIANSERGTEQLQVLENTAPIQSDYKEQNDVSNNALNTITKDTTQQETDSIKSEDYSKEQAWHFIMWNDKQQLEKLRGDSEEQELSLIEYGEYWRTNLVKQVRKNDIVFLFRRGGYGYIGAYRAIGWRVFYFEEGREEIQRFDKGFEEINIKEKENQYLLDIEKYDIYKSKDDGATTCANIIVKPIAFVEDGVGYYGGVYRRTISRYDPHYAGWLKNKFQEKGQWKEQ